MTNQNPPIIIAKDDPKVYLTSIAKRLMTEDEIKIHVIDKHLPKAEYLIRMLRKSFGIIETGRKRVNTLNAICIYNDGGKCTNPDAGFQGMCNEAIRSQCSKYKARFTNKFEVNEIQLEKIAAIRSL
jgi:hypothetical protein